MNPEIRLFLESLLADKAIKAEGELKEKMISELNERLQALFLQIILEKLDPEDMEEFETPGKSAEDVQSLLMTKIPGLKDDFKRAMAEFRQAFLQG